MKLICCTTPLPPSSSSSSSSLLFLLLFSHLNLILSLLCGEDWTRHFNLFILDMNLLACLPLSITLPTSIHRVHRHTQKLCHTYLRTCMRTHTAVSISMHRHCTHTHFIPHRYLNKSLSKSQPSCAQTINTHTHTYTC